MSSTTTWNAGSSKRAAAEFDYSVLYYTIIKMFETTYAEDENEWAEQTLQWLNQEFYGHPEGLSGATTSMQPVDDDDDNDWALMIKNRAARQMARVGFAREAAGDAPNTGDGRSSLDRDYSTAPVQLPMSEPEPAADPPIDPILLAMSQERLVVTPCRATPEAGVRREMSTPPPPPPPLPPPPAQMTPPVIDHAMSVPTAPHPSGQGVPKRTTPSTEENSTEEHMSVRPRKKTTVAAGTTHGKKTRGGAPKAVAKRSTRQTTAGRNTTGN